MRLNGALIFTARRPGLQVPCQRFATASRVVDA
jgi:hypothetical protein